MNLKHGKVGSPEYRTWTNMITRCTNPKCHAFRNYGGRGIKVCDRWLSFADFYADMGERPSGKTLDRIDNNGNYELSNCRWVGIKEQRQNSRRTNFLTMNGETYCIAEWSRKTGVKRTTIQARISKGQQPFECCAKMMLAKK